MLLAVHRGQVVGVDRIVEALWEDGPPRQPEQNVATLVSRLRAVLGPEVITGGRGGYRLGAPPAVRVDVDVAAAVGRRGAPASCGWGTRDRDVRRLAGRWRCSVPVRCWWASPTRSGCWRRGRTRSDLVREARHTAAAAALLVDDPTAAVRVSAAAIEADRFDEAAHRLPDDRLSRSGGAVEGAGHVRAIAGGPGRRTGCRPAPETRQVHVAVLREQSADVSGLPATRVRGPVSLRGPDRSALPGRDDRSGSAAGRRGRRRPPAGQR